MGDHKFALIRYLHQWQTGRVALKWAQIPTSSLTDLWTYVVWHYNDSDLQTSNTHGKHTSRKKQSAGKANHAPGHTPLISGKLWRDSWPRKWWLSRHLLHEHLCKWKIVDQNIQPSVFLIEEVSHPPVKFKMVCRFTKTKPKIKKHWNIYNNPNSYATLM